MRPRPRRRRPVLWLCALAAAVAVGSCWIPVRPIKQTKQPRAGWTIGGRVAVVYCRHYQINLAGYEM